jgi:hypothetical protein
MKGIEMTVEVIVNGHSFRVSGSFTPALPGVYSGPPERCYPSEDAEFEIRTVHLLHEDGSEPTYLPLDFLECFYIGGMRIVSDGEGGGTSIRAAGMDLYEAIANDAAAAAEDSYDDEGDRADEAYDRQRDRELDAAMEAGDPDHDEEQR